MKVIPAAYYTAKRYHRHEAVQIIISWANSMLINPQYGPYAHRIKCLVIKRYKRAQVHFIPLCKKWEDNPVAFAKWLSKQPKGYRIKLLPGATEYSPETLAKE